MPELNIIGAAEDNRYFPYQKAFRVTRKSFWQAGQDSYSAPPTQNPDMFQALTNVEPVNKGVLQRRRGYQLLSNQAPAIPYREGYSFRSESLNLKSQVWTSTSNVLALNEDGSANLNTIFTPSLNAAFAPRMVLSRNYGYFADGVAADNLKWDGTPNTLNTTNWGIDINNVAGLTAGPNAPGTATDLGGSPTNGSQGPNGPSTATNINNPSYSSNSWANPNGIFAPDGNYATVQIGLGGLVACNYLQGTGYGYTLPGTATVLGIKVEILRKATSANTCALTNIELVVGGSPIGSFRSEPAASIPTSPTYSSFGGPTDMWGLTTATLNPANINASNFGVLFNAFNGTSNFDTVSVDFVRITVYYTAPSAGSWTNPNNIKVQDGAVATAIATTSQSSELQATNFGFAASGVVAGIQVDIKLSTSSGSPTISPVLTKNSAASGSRKTATITNTSLGFVTFGGPTDLWGAALGSWSLADVNSANFGVQWFVLTNSGSPTVSVDFVRITVFSITAPPAIAVAGTGITLLSGTVYTIAFQNSISGHVSHFTPFSTNTGPLTNQGIALSNIAVSLDPQVDTKVILRPADGADTTTLYLVGSIPNATTTFNDTMPDSTLLTQPVFQQTNQDGTLHGIANNKRPPAMLFPTKHKGRIYGSIQSTLFYSKNLDEVLTSTGTITSKWEEAFPATNQMDVSETAETIQGIMSDGETLWMATERCIRRLIGDSPGNFQKPEIQFNEAGLLNMDSWKITFKEDQPVGTMWLTPDFKVMFSDFNNYKDVGTPIQNVLNTINPTAVATIHACFVAKGPAEYYKLYIPTGVNTKPDTICVYNLRTQRWCVWSATDLITGSLFFIDGSGAPRWTFATNAGPLYEWNENIFSDRVNNTASQYPVTIQTSWLDFGDEGLTKAFNKIIVTTGDVSLTISVQGAIRETDFATGGVLVLPPTTVQAELFGDLFIPMVAQPGLYKWYQLTFVSPASSVVDVLDAFDFEIMPSMRM